MEIHKPKPFHNLREFLSEIAIIVIGVLIALSAEQAVETLHWRHKLHAIEEAMRWELAEDDLPQAYARALIGPCLERQLDGLQRLAQPGADGAAFARAARDYAPPYRTWDSNAYAVLNQSDISSHMTLEQVQGWTRGYLFMPKMSEFTAREADLIAVLRRTRFGSRRLTPGDADEINDTIDMLRAIHRKMFGASRSMTADTDAMLGIRISDKARLDAWQQARTVYGTCIPALPPSVRAISRSFGLSYDKQVKGPLEH